MEPMPRLAPRSETTATTSAPRSSSYRDRRASGFNEAQPKARPATRSGADAARPEVYEEISCDPDAAPEAGKRARLLLDAASNFCLHARPREEDIRIFREFFTQLIGICGKADRRALAATIAPNAYVPRSIAFYLALDEAEVAAPILLLSPVLKEADIIALARKVGQAQLQVLCRRNDLTPASVVSLLANGGRAAAELLAKNAKAPRDAAPQANEMAEHRVAGPGPTVETVKPKSAPPSVAQRVEPETPKAGPADRSDELLELAGKGGRLGRGATASLVPSRRLPVEIDEKKLARRFLDAARIGGLLDTADLMARQASCSLEIVVNLLASESIEPLCVLMKGFGLDPLPATQLILLLRPQTGRNREELAKATGFYRRLNGEECRRFVETLGGGEPAPDKSAANLADAVSARRREIATRDTMRPAQRPLAGTMPDAHTAGMSGRG